MTNDEHAEDSSTVEKCDDELPEVEYERTSGTGALEPEFVTALQAIVKREYGQDALASNPELYKQYDVDVLERVFSPGKMLRERRAIRSRQSSYTDDPQEDNGYELSGAEAHIRRCAVESLDQKVSQFRKSLERQTTAMEALKGVLEPDLFEWLTDSIEDVIADGFSFDQLEVLFAIFLGFAVKTYIDTKLVGLLPVTREAAVDLKSDLEELGEIRIEGKVGDSIAKGFTRRLLKEIPGTREFWELTFSIQDLTEADEGLARAINSDLASFLKKNASKTVEAIDAYVAVLGYAAVLTTASENRCDRCGKPDPDRSHQSKLDCDLSSGVEAAQKRQPISSKLWASEIE